MTKMLFVLMASSAIIIGSPTLAASTSGGGDSGGGAVDGAAVGSFYNKIIGQLPPNVVNAISITKDGDTTKVTFDIEQLLQPLASSGVKVTAKPFTLVYMPLPDGTIREESGAPADFGITYSLPITPPQTGSFTYQGLTVTSIIDPKLAFIREMNGSLAKAFGDVNQEANGTSASVVAGQQTFTLHSEAAQDNTINVHQTQTVTGFIEHVQIDPSKAAQPTSGPKMDMDFKVPEIKAQVDVNGLRSLAARDLIVFLLNNQSSAQIAAKQAELKSDIRKLLPLFNSMAVSGEAHGVSVQSAFGQGLIGTFGFSAALDTSTPSSSFSIGERFEDIKIDTVFMPPWARSLVPTAVDLEFGVNGFDIAGMLNKFADAMDKHDLTDPKPDQTDYQALGREAIMPNDTIHMDLKPSSIVSPVYKISWTGGMDTHRVREPNVQATAHIDVTATGLDDLIKTLTPVHEKGVPEAIIGLYAAKALAKPGQNGALLWALDIDSQTGLFLVNGKPVGPQPRKL